nr:bifunctional ornithine acetyltransferase/N-acetylglutamate synthase [Angustibacter aerolatus]
MNDGPAHAAAAVYTQNRCAAHPVTWSRTASGDGVVRAVVLNSGGANCYTGAQGFATTHATAEPGRRARGRGSRRRRGVLHRPDRRAGSTATGSRPASAPPRRRSRPTAVPTRPGRS